MAFYDLIFSKLFADETQALEVLEVVLRRATSLSKTERYDHAISHLWIMGITVSVIRRMHPKALAERVETPSSGHRKCFHWKRSWCSSSTIAQTLNYFRDCGHHADVGGARGGTPAHLRATRESGARRAAWASIGPTRKNTALRERLLWNSSLETASATAPTRLPPCKPCWGRRIWCKIFRLHSFLEIEPSVRLQRFMPFFGRTDQKRAGVIFRGA